MMVFRLIWILVLLALSCAHQPQTRLAQPTPTFVDWQLTDASGQALGPPKALSDSVYKSLDDRGFSVVEAADDATYRVTVQTTVRRFMRVDGAYRWVAQGAIQVTDGADLKSHKTWSHAHYLDVEFAAESRVLSALAPEISGEVNQALTKFIALGAPLAPAEIQTAEDAIRPKRTGQLGPYHPNDSIYFVMVDRFHNGDPSNDGVSDPKDAQAFHGGDIAGLIQKLDWIQTLGVRTIWLSPIFKMRDTPFYGHGAFHGYWLEDPFQVEPRFGDEALLKQLKAELKKRNMRLILDIVVNHVAPESERVKTHAHWFHPHGPITDWKDPVQLETYQVHGLPDLDQSNPEVYAWLRDSTAKWIQLLEPDGLRMDAVKHVPAEFWRRFNAEMQSISKKPLVILGEHLDGDVANVAKTARDGGFNAMFDFPLHFAMVDVFCKDQSPGRLAAVLAQDGLYKDTMGPHRQGLVTLLDNHDLSRIISSCLGDRGRVLQALKFMLSVRGTPSFTWGTEVGSDGGQEPENRSSMRFDDSHPMLAATQELIRKRAEHTVLREGVDHVLVLEDEFYALLRVGKTEAALLIVNTSATLKNVILPPELQPVRASHQVAANTTELVILNADPEHLRQLRERISKPSRTEIRVEVTGIELKDGERLVLAGSLPELGSWDPMKAPEFKVESGRLVLPLSLSTGAVGAGKLVVVSGANATWEERSDRFFLARSGQDVLRFTWQR